MFRESIKSNHTLPLDYQQAIDLYNLFGYTVVLREDNQAFGVFEGEPKPNKFNQKLRANVLALTLETTVKTLHRFSYEKGKNDGYFEARDEMREFIGAKWE